MLDLRKTGLCAAAIGCGVLAARSGFAAPRTLPGKTAAALRRAVPESRSPTASGAGYAAARQAGDTQEAWPPDRPPISANGRRTC